MSMEDRILRQQEIACGESCADYCEKLEACDAEIENLEATNLALRKEICRLKDVNHNLVEQVLHWKNKKW